MATDEEIQRWERWALPTNSSQSLERAVASEPHCEGSGADTGSNSRNQRSMITMKTMKILMVLTSHDKLRNTGRKTGFWLEEFAAPYYTFLDAGATVTVASPK